MSGFAPPPQMAPAGPPGMPSGAPPGLMPNPAYAQWQKASAAAQAIQQQNMLLQQQFDAAVAVIKKDGIHGFRLDIEADSTIAPDQAQEKQARTELIAELVPLLSQVVPIAQGNPAMASLAKEIVLFGVRGQPAGRPIEEAIEKAFDAIAQMPPNPKVSGQPQGKPGAAPPNPQLEAAKVQADVHDTDAKTQTDRLAIAQKAQAAQEANTLGMAKLQSENQRSQMQTTIAAAELQQRERLEQARVAAIGARGAAGLV